MALRKLFEGADLHIEDLYLLESFQIEYFPRWLPQRELASVLWAHPHIYRFLRTKSPAISRFLDETKVRYPPATIQRDLARAEEAVIWTMAEFSAFQSTQNSTDLMSSRFGCNPGRIGATGIRSCIPPIVDGSKNRSADRLRVQAFSGGPLRPGCGAKDLNGQLLGFKRLVEVFPTGSLRPVGAPHQDAHLVQPRQAVSHRFKAGHEEVAHGTRQCRRWPNCPESSAGGSASPVGGSVEDVG